MSAPPLDISAPEFSRDRARDRVVRAALKDLRDDLGFQTASLFVRDSSGWKLIHRVGPNRAWHALLDPMAVEGTDAAAQYGDVRALPGIGSRLATMGCGSLAVLPIPGGGRILLDSSTPSIVPGWIDRARPYLSLLAAMSGPAWTLDGALHRHDEVGAIERVFAACQGHVADPASTTNTLLSAVRTALAAHELFLLSEDESGVRVDICPAEVGRTVPGDLGTDLSHLAQDPIDPVALRRLGLSLGVTSGSLAAAFGRDEHPLEVLVASWRDGPALSDVSMAVVARAVTTAGLAVQGRREAVDSLLDRERTQMAYALHDGLLQTVTGAVLELEGLRRRIQEDPQAAMAVLDGSKAEIRRALTELRDRLFRLSATPEGPGGRGAFVRSVRDVIARWRLPVRVTVEGDLDAVPEPIRAVAYVVVRESLANAAKHSGGANVTVSLEAARGQLRVAVSDRGHGFTPRDEETARQGHHMGLQMLRNRVKEVGGTLAIDSQPGRGTRVVATLPISEVKP